LRVYFRDQSPKSRGGPDHYFRSFFIK